MPASAHSSRGKVAMSKPARRIVIPAIPRALERKHGSGALSASEGASPVASQEGHVPTAASEASETRRDELAESRGTLKPEPPQVDIASASNDRAPPTPVNWPTLDAPQMERAQSERSNTEVSSQGEPSLGITPNGSVPMVFSPSVVLPRLDNGIIFGSGESLGSSPTIPPSAGSTIYTHSTPLSDNGPHSGYKGPASALETAGHCMNFAKPPEPTVDQSTHEHTHSRQSLSSGASNVEETYHHVGGPGTFVIPGSLQAYMLGQFDDPTFADCVLDIDVRGEHKLLSVHTMVIARSGTLHRLLLEYPQHGPSGKRHISLSAHNQALTLAAVRDAVRVCYGEALPSPQRRLRMPGTPGVGGEASSMRTSLADLAAGQLLDMFDMSAAATACIREIVGLGNVEELLAFLFADSLGVIDDSPQSEYVTPPLARMTIHGPWTFELVSLASSVIASHMKGSFVFDHSAPPAALLHGFPAVFGIMEPGNGGFTPQHKRASSSRVVGIQFGDFPSIPDVASTTISSLLLSLPFNFLRHILLLVRTPYAADVVAERERRRDSYLRNLTAAGETSDRISPSAYWRESFDAAENEVRRVWVGP